MLDYEYFSKHYKLTTTDLSMQTQLKENLDLKQQINFIDRIGEDNATMFFIIGKTKEASFDFLQNSVIVI